MVKKLRNSFGIKYEKSLLEFEKCLTIKYKEKWQM
jgi:hypothetical protein